MTGTNLVPECYFVWLGQLLKRGVTTVGTISALTSAGFTDYGAVLAKCSTSSKGR